MSLLRLKALKKAFRTPDGSTQTIVDIPQFELQEGQHLALVGGSGSGKTTLLHLISGILTADSGTVTLAGHELTALSEGARDRIRAQYLGYVFQTFNLLQGYSALENVLLGMAFGPGADRTRALELLARVGLSDRIHYRPRQLSVGQQQRVAVARALANRPLLVLADEPTGNLDRHNALEALKLIRETCRENGAALLLVSHDPNLLAQFEQQVDLCAVNRAMQTGDVLLSQARTGTSVVEPLEKPKS